MKYILLLTLTFTAQKLAGAITWDWLWVLSPLWLSISYALITGFINGFRIAYRNARATKSTQAKVGRIGQAQNQSRTGEAQPSEPTIQNVGHNLAQDAAVGAHPRTAMSRVRKPRPDHGGNTGRSH